MCVRIVFVLVLCCVQSWAQRDPTWLRGFQDRAENPGMHPQGRLSPSDQFPVLTDLPIQPDILPQPIIVQSPGFSNIPENTSMPPEEMPPPPGQSSDIPGTQEYPQGRPPLLGPPPGTSAFPGRLDVDNADDQKPPETQKKTVNFAGEPRNLSVTALPLEGSDHELQFNVSWLPSSGLVEGYSVEVVSLTETSDSKIKLCYQIIQKNVTWILVPPTYSSVHGDCVIRPGCAYLIIVKSDPWDGKTTANLTKELEECEAGVCSCAHSPRLPAPVVSASPFTRNNTLYANVSWYLPTPSYPQRLPAKLGKQGYIITAKQMESYNTGRLAQSLSHPTHPLVNQWSNHDVHTYTAYSLNKQIPTLTNAPSYFKILKDRTVHVDIGGLVFEGDTRRWKFLPISQDMELNMKLLAKVELVDERGCRGPAGDATVFAPTRNEKLPFKSQLSFGVYAILGAVIGAFAMGAIFVLSVKRVLKCFRPAPVSAPLETLIRRPVRFNNYYEHEK